MSKSVEPGWTRCLKYFLKTWQQRHCFWLHSPRAPGVAGLQSFHRVDLLKYTLKCASAPTRPEKLAKKTHASIRDTIPEGEQHRCLTAHCLSHVPLNRRTQARVGGRKAERGHITLLSLQLLHKTNKSMLGREVMILGPDVTGHNWSSYHDLCTY